MADASPVHLTRASHQASNEISRSLRAHAPVWSNPLIPIHAQLEERVWQQFSQADALMLNT